MVKVLRETSLSCLQYSVSSMAFSLTHGLVLYSSRLVRITSCSCMNISRTTVYLAVCLFVVSFLATLFTISPSVSAMPPPFTVGVFIVLFTRFVHYLLSSFASIRTRKESAFIFRLSFVAFPLAVLFH